MPCDDRPPDDETGAFVGEPLQARHRRHVVAVAEQDDAVGPVAQFVIGVPVVAQLLERDQQVEPAPRGRARDVAEHRQEERVDLRVVRRLLEQQQGQRLRAARAQSGRAAISPIAQLLRDRLDARAGVRRRTSGLLRKRARDGRLRNLRQARDVA